MLKFDEVFNIDLCILLLVECFCSCFQYLPEGSPRAYEALYAANEIINTCDPFDASTFPR